LQTFVIVDKTLLVKLQPLTLITA